jgi:hypothetical protein
LVFCYDAIREEGKKEREREEERGRKREIERDQGIGEIHFI